METDNLKHKRKFSMTKAETVIMRKREIKVPSYRNGGYES